MEEDVAEDLSDIGLELLIVRFDEFHIITEKGEKEKFKMEYILIKFKFI